MQKIDSQVRKNPLLNTQEKYYTYQILQPHHKQDLLDLIVSARKVMSPLMKAFSKFESMSNHQDEENQRFYWNQYIDRFVNEGLSVAGVDVTQKIIVNICGMDFATAYTNETFQNCSSQGLYLAAEYELFNQLVARQPIEVQKAQKIPGMVCELCAASSSPDLKERGIFRKTIPLAMELARQKGFKFVLALCFNSKMRDICLDFGLRKVAEVDLKQFEFRGLKPFAEVEEKDRYPCILWKDL